jgi:CHASE2 domain-containing sensor protein
MFKRLQQKWEVKGWQLLLILLTFALGGSLTGFVGRRLLALTGLQGGVLFVLAYIVVMTLIWPFMVLLVSIPLGQFSFFRRYLRRLGRKLFNR